MTARAAMRAVSMATGIANTAIPPAQADGNIQSPGKGIAIG